MNDTAATPTTAAGAAAPAADVRFNNPAGNAAAAAQSYVAALLGLLGQQDPLAVLATTPDQLGARTRGLAESLLRQPEAPGKWSLVQVTRHLADSELVCGYRLRRVLAEDRPRIHGYDQDRWAERLGYAAADLESALALFRALRTANVAMLRAATPEDFARVGLHDERGEESVALMVRLYAAHDLVHLRQVERIRAAIGAPA